MPRSKILMLSSEAVPFAKSGGLADVVSALAKSLAELDLDVRILLPLYGFIDRSGLEDTGAEIGVPVGIEDAPARIYRSALPSSPVVVYFLAIGQLFDRDGIYGDRANAPYPDNARRFAALNRGAFEVCRAMGWIPDVMHVHDWPACLAPLYLNRQERAEEFASCASVLTIHNIAYQGKFARQDLFVTQVPWEAMRDADSDDCATINFLKAGIRAADMITTVSPTYAKEIRTSEYGEGLDPLLRERASEVVGILNGIDYAVWSPATDPLIPFRYSSADLAPKARDKEALQARCGFPLAPEVPLIGMVSRLVDQKGFAELVKPGWGSLERICSQMAVQAVILGTGEPWCEEELKRLEARLPNLRVYLEFSNATAHLIEAGSDFFLMPSRYEPCGLNQMYSLRYGTLPIVRRTGGLADTVEQYDQESAGGTGFLFDDLTPGSVYDVVGWAVWAWYNRKDHVETMRRRAMERDFSWTVPARAYAGVYERARLKRGSRP